MAQVVPEVGWLVVPEVGWLVVPEVGWLVVPEVGWLVVPEALPGRLTVLSVSNQGKPTHNSVGNPEDEAPGHVPQLGYATGTR